MKGKGPIAILLLLCFSVVLVHGMVPHHHHHGVVAESSASCCDNQRSSQNRHSSQSHQSPYGSQSSRDHHDPCNHHNHQSHHNAHDQCKCGESPQHCDAFNEITLFKSNDSRIDAPLVVKNLFQAANCSEVLQLDDRSTNFGYYVPRTILHTTCPGGRTISLRGPPSTTRIPA